MTCGFRRRSGLTGLLLSAAILLGPPPARAQGVGSSSPPQVSSAQLVGSDVCRACHGDVAAPWEATGMGRVFLKAPRNDLEAEGCEACHGPGSEHVRNAGDTTRIFRFGKASPASVAEKNARCLQCHENGARHAWLGSAHESRNIACVDCHTVMQQISPEKQLAKPTVEQVCYQCHLQRRAQAQLSSHMPVREGKVSCKDCHNPHGTSTAKLLLAGTVNEVCYTCHPERRGPFLWEHAPVTENCLNCHDAHGSVNDNLLKVRVPRLCQRCHIETRHPTTPQSAASRFAFNRGCLNCHSQIHGSNHPSGVRFHR